jgi:hypothetical protein
MRCPWFVRDVRLHRRGQSGSLISAAGCMLHRRAWHVAHSARRFKCALHLRALHRCGMHRRALHRRALHRRALHRRALHRRALHRRALHRRALHRRIGDAQPSRSAPPWDALHRVLRACAARLGGGRAVRWPSGDAMRSYAGLRRRRRRRRRALHGQGHRVVRRRGDIRHRDIGACGAGRCSEPGPIDGGRGCAGCAQYGGVVRMDDGTVTFKGGTISRTWAVRALRSHAACRKRSCLTLHVARAGACHVLGMPR